MIKTLAAVAVAVAAIIPVTCAYAENENALYGRLRNGTPACDQAILTVRKGAVDDGDAAHARAKLALLKIAEVAEKKDIKGMEAALNEGIEANMALTKAYGRHVVRWENVGTACDSSAITKQVAHYHGETVKVEQITTRLRKALIEWASLPK